MNWLRLLLMLFSNIFKLPFIMSKLNKIAYKDTNLSEQEKYNFIKNIAINANKGGRIKVNKSGIENLPKENGYIMFPNHQGYYDTLAIIEAHDKIFGIVIKKEAADIILIKQVIKVLKGISIDRKNIKSSLEVINYVAEFVKNGGNFLIFPEGTRSKEGNKLGKMKAGAFKSAVISKSPIVPIAIIDCFKPFDTKGIHKVEVEVNFLKPLYYDDYKNMKTVEIADRVEKEIQEYIDDKLKSR